MNKENASKLWKMIQEAGLYLPRALNQPTPTKQQATGIKENLLI